MITKEEILHWLIDTDKKYTSEQAIKMFEIISGEFFDKTLSRMRVTEVINVMDCMQEYASLTTQGAGRWEPIETAPKDGRTIEFNYRTPDKPEISLVFWSDRPVCMGGPTVYNKPGWATAGDDVDKNLPLDPAKYWREEGSESTPSPSYDELLEALKELCELNDMKESGVVDDLSRLKEFADYMKRKPLAWLTARKLIENSKG